MEITGPLATSPASPQPITSAQAMVDAWKVGQLVNARVVTQTQNGQATINVGGTLLLAQSPLPLQPGQTLQLEVRELAAQAILKLATQLSNSPPLQLKVPSQSHAINQWQTGKILDALVVTSNERGITRLNIAGQLIDTKLPQLLPLNQPLKLEIIDPGKIAALRILNTSPVSENLAQALRTLLPQQAPLPPLLNALASIAQTPSTPITPPHAGQSPPLPPAVIELARSIIDKLPNAKSLTTAEGLQQALSRSGPFLEARLAQAIQQTAALPSQATIDLGMDLKGGLLSLLASLFTLTKPAPMLPLAQQSIPLGQLTQYLQQALQHAQPQTTQPSHQQAMLQQSLLDLMRNVESGLARIVLNQFAASGTEDDNKRSWVVDIPVRHEQHVELIQLRIDKDAQQHHKNKPTVWTVNLTLELQSLGTIQVAITLAAGMINTTFWAEQETTTTLINHHIDSLYQNLRDAGLSVGKISALQGKSPESRSAIPQLPQVLLDVKA